MIDTICANESFALPGLHSRLIGLQSLTELRRKATKARRRGYWTLEEFDYARRNADYWFEFFKTPVTFVNSRAETATCLCGNTHYWTISEYRWECDQCQQYVFERDFAHTSLGNDNW